jgi:hypothetical protein
LKTVRESPVDAEPVEHEVRRVRRGAHGDDPRAVPARDLACHDGGDNGYDNDGRDAVGYGSMPDRDDQIDVGQRGEAGGGQRQARVRTGSAGVRYRDAGQRVANRAGHGTLIIADSADRLA